LKDSHIKPHFIFWTWCVYPEDALRIRRAYPSARFLHYLQYEQFFKPMADPRILRWSRALGGARMIALGGPKSAHGYLFWGDPEWAFRVVRDLCAKNGEGLFIETFHALPWLSRETFARAAWSGSSYREAFWESLLVWRYGDPRLGRPLLSAMKQASRIMPRFLALVHSQTDHYQPQFGLPLVYYLEMPTLSSYVFENYDYVDKQGYLRPNRGLCYPNPDWGERVLSIWEYVGRPKGSSAPQATTPPDIARELERYGFACVEASEKLRRISVSKNEAEYRQTMDLLTLNGYLGLHFSAKIRAAVAWARFRKGQFHGEDVLEWLRRSIEYWQKASDIAWQLYPYRFRLWQSQMTLPPPWRQNDIWNSYALVEGHWRDQIPRFQRELEIIAGEFQKLPSQTHLPLFEEIAAYPDAKTHRIASFNFEEALLPEMQLSSEASWTADPREVLSGQGSLKFDTRNASGEWHMPLLIPPDLVRLTQDRFYQVEFDYCILEASAHYPTPFAIAARSHKGGVSQDIGTARFWGGPKGTTGHRVVLMDPRRYDDYAIFFSVRGKAALVIDNLQIKEVIP